MVKFAVFFTLGAWLLQRQAELPAMMWAWLLPALLLPLLVLPSRTQWQRVARAVLLAACALTAGFFHAAMFAHLRLSDKLPAAWQGRNIKVIGVVAELPRLHERSVSFAFDVERSLTPGVHVPRHILLSSYADRRGNALQLHAGERWQFTVRLKRPHGTANPHAFDFEEWMLERDLRASGYVYGRGDNRLLDARVARPRYLLERLRERIRDRLLRVLGRTPDTGVLTALAIGDQASISQSQWQVFRRTGVTHLMSISGLHVTMLGSLAFFVVYFLWRRSTRLTLHFPARKAAAVAGLFAALTYALLSGFGVPAQRTVYMLATVALALLSSRNIAPSQVLAAALLVVTILDPWAVLAPGFWLSFGAVGLILYISANRLAENHRPQTNGSAPSMRPEDERPVVTSLRKRSWAWLRRSVSEYAGVQWAITIGLVPLLLAMFQQVSLISPLANAFAIPVISFVVVPPTLLGAALPLDWPLHFAHAAMKLCMDVLVWLSGMPNAIWQQHAPPAWTILAGVAGVLWALLPRGFPARWLGLMLLLPLFLLPADLPPAGTLRLTIFDVGQGLAVAIRTRNHVLLYDTGPDYPGESDSGSRIVVPVLHALGVSRIDTLLLSHDDIDHIGGAASVLAAMPVGEVLSSLPAHHRLLRHRRNARRCRDGQRWKWDGVAFEMLGPAANSYLDKTHDNNLSCVLRISTGTNSVLLAGDIERAAEWYLLRQHPAQLSASLLVVPHHGSRSSSMQEFVAAVHPRYALFSCGYRNRFGHPHAEILARYRKSGSLLLRTDELGALQIGMSQAGIRLAGYRSVHRRYWYPHAGE